MKEYPMSPPDQLKLFQQCLLEADQVVQEYQYKIQVASALFAYRINHVILSDNGGVKK